LNRRTRVHKNRERRELTVERIVALQPKLAWEGWTQPEHIARWWGPRFWTATVYEMDVRPGGIWRYSLKSDDGSGEEAFCRAVYHEVNEPSNLVYTDSFSDKNWNVVDNSDMFTTVSFEEVTEGTRLNIVTRFANDQDLDQAEAMGMVEGYTDALGRLEQYLNMITGGKTMQTIISKDGTKITFEKQGNGPAVILVAPAVADHGDAAQLADRLAEHFTVYNYDRRGRGQSSDATTYAIEREIEDIQSIISEAGGKAYLFGSSSGAVLALDASSKLGDQVIKLFLYEPPFIINDSRAPVPAEYVRHLNELIEANRRSDAVEYFMTEAVGIPGEFVTYMKADPSWNNMENMAHTLAYDGLIMADTQSGKPLPTDRWQVSIPTSIMTGENSEPIFHDAAKALASLLPQAEHRLLTGQDHSAVVMAPDVLATAITDFFHNPIHTSEANTNG
jgi:uncharacterized protein YndB with AHSA1/START domain/pimeloyl-ACP methyl ester carboxylesterase